MEFEFTCECGEDIADFTRGRNSKEVHTICECCGSRYVVTVTKILYGAEAP